MTQRNDGMSVSQWQSEFTNHIVRECLRLIKDEEKEFGRDFGDASRLSVIASFVSTVLFEAMTTAAKDGAALGESDEYVHSVFREIKDSVETAVSSGAMGATQAFSGRVTEYVCQILPVPEPQNKLAC